MLTDWTVTQIKNEFIDYQPPSCFSGGCKKTNCQGFCVQLKPDGSIGSVEENCEHYEQCKGHKSRYRI